MSALYGHDAYTMYGQEQPGLLNEFGYPVKANGGIDGHFWLGLEPEFGRDVLMQLLFGIRTSLLIAASVVAVVTVVGTIAGVAAGYFGGKTDFVISRVIDVALAFPATLFFLSFTPLILSLFVADDENASTGLRVMALIVALSLFSWTKTARLLRGQVLSLREREFVKAAKVAGCSPWRVMTKELLPNLWTPILVTVTLEVPMMVTTEAALSYLGVGIVEPTPDWGRMIKNGAAHYLNDITYMAIPGLAMLVFVVAFNLFGDSLRDALDPAPRAEPTLQPARPHSQPRPRPCPALPEGHTMNRRTHRRAAALLVAALTASACSAAGGGTPKQDAAKPEALSPTVVSIGTTADSKGPAAPWRRPKRVAPSPSCRPPTSSTSTRPWSTRRTPAPPPNSSPVASPATSRSTARPSSSATSPPTPAPRPTTARPGRSPSRTASSSTTAPR
ncbi:ABC transporter permease [Kitasatospora paranensis]|uniref:ABC transporter permease n=1 Tax=Kitasatospora paranensis TaxID=258053 RepID=UPI0031F04910